MRRAAAIVYTQDVFAFGDDLFWTKGKHGVKFGALINHFEQYANNAEGYKGTVSFTSRFISRLFWGRVGTIWFPLRDPTEKRHAVRYARFLCAGRLSRAAATDVEFLGLRAMNSIPNRTRKIGKPIILYDSAVQQRADARPQTVNEIPPIAT